MMKYISLATLAVVGATAQATVLTFADLGLSNYGAIPQTYGDNVTGPGGTGGSYLQGNGWTPNITTSYLTVDANGAETSPSISYWGTGYGDLLNSAFPASSGRYARVTLTPAAGWDVVLNSFSLAGYPQANLTADRIRVIGANGNELWSSSNLLVNGVGPSRSNYAPNLRSSGPLTIEFGTNWNIGISNINFDQANPVPEPTTLAGLGIAALLLQRRKRAK